MVLYISHALRVRGIKMSVDKSISYVTAWFIEVGSGVVLVKKAFSFDSRVRYGACYVQVQGAARICGDACNNVQSLDTPHVCVLTVRTPPNANSYASVFRTSVH
jgi:hypothetical protein